MYKIKLIDCLTSKPFKIEHFNDRTILVPVHNIITPKTIIKIDNEGMIYENN